MTNYEVLYIISPKADDKKRDEIIAKFCDVVTAAGGTANVTKIGLKKLAYEIKFVKEGFYVLMDFSAPENIPAEIERQMRITDEIFRFMVTKKVENKLTRKEAERREEQAKRNEAREAKEKEAKQAKADAAAEQKTEAVETAEEVPTEEIAEAPAEPVSDETTEAVAEAPAEVPAEAENVAAEAAEESKE